MEKKKCISVYIYIYIAIENINSDNEKNCQVIAQILTHGNQIEMSCVFQRNNNKKKSIYIL